jgi:hypothetical protein
MAVWVSADMPPRQRGPLHVDVDAKVHNRGQQLLTLIGIDDIVAGGQTLGLDGMSAFKDVTLEPGGERVPLYFTASPPGDELLTATLGEALTFKLRLTRGGLRAPRVKLSLSS